MRNRALYTAVVFLAGLLVSCQQLGQETDSGAEAIYLKAGVSQAVETRAPYTLTTPTSAAPLEVSVWARTGGHTYQNLGYNGKTPGHENEVAIHTSARFQSGETPQLLTDAVYPQDPGGGAPPPVYFVALHPLTSWVNENTAGTADYNYASYTFDGKTDVLLPRKCPVTTTWASRTHLPSTFSTCSPGCELK